MTQRIDEIEENVPEVIRGLKRISGVSDAQIGEAIGVSRTVANMRITGKSKWSYAELVALAEYFGVPVDLLLEEPRDAMVTALKDYEVASRFPKKARPSNLPIRRSTWTHEEAGHRGLIRAG